MSTTTVETVSTGESIALFLSLFLDAIGVLANVPEALGVGFAIGGIALLHQLVRLRPSK